MRDTHRVTVRNLRPTLIEGHRYTIVNYNDEAKVGEYRIEIEIDGASKVSLHEGSTPSGDKITIQDLDTVKVLGAYQVAF